MKSKALVKVAGVFALMLACALGVSACGSNAKVAATINGTNIMEDDVTKQIETVRTSYGMEDDETWAEYLSYYGMTPSDLRETVIKNLAEEEVIKSEAKANNVTADSSEVDTYYNQVRSYYDTDEDWKSALESAGLTEETYREQLEQSVLEQALMDVVTPLTDPSDEDVLTYVSMYATYYYDGAKKSSHILFDASDTETAQSVLDQINAGTLSFEDAAKQYSKDTGSASDGGNVGWDCLNSFVTEYTDALDELEEGQVSGLVTSDYGIHIIKCTQVFTAPDEITDLSQVPSEMVDSVRETVKSYNQQSDFSEWLETKVEESDLKINDMPSGLSYDVDMSAYETDSNTENTTTDNTNANTENTENAANNENASNNEATNENSGSSN